MTYHFIPTSEQTVHEASVDCACQPTLIPSFNLEDCDDLSGEICYEHFHFGIEEKIDKLTDYTVWSEGSEIKDEEV